MSWRGDEPCASLYRRIWMPIKNLKPTQPTLENLVTGRSAQRYGVSGCEVSTVVARPGTLEARRTLGEILQRTGRT